MQGGAVVFSCKEDLLCFHARRSGSVFMRGVAVEFSCKEEL